MNGPLRWLWLVLAFVSGALASAPFAAIPVVEEPVRASADQRAEVPTAPTRSAKTVARHRVSSTVLAPPLRATRGARAASAKSSPERKARESEAPVIGASVIADPVVAEVTLPAPTTVAPNAREPTVAPSRAPPFTVARLPAFVPSAIRTGAVGDSAADQSSDRSALASIAVDTAAADTTLAVIANGTTSSLVADERITTSSLAPPESVVRVLSDVRSLQIVNVARPASLATDSVVRFQLRSFGAVPLLGQREGVLSRPDDHVLFTISVPASARAGRLAVATLRFTSSTGVDVDVPVEVMVRARRQVTLTPLTGFVSLAQGGRTTIRIRLDNGGNATDSMLVKASLPPLWRARVVEGDQVILAANQSTERTVEIHAPSGGSTGAIPLTWLAIGATAGDDSLPSERTRLETMLEVLSVADGERAGPAVGLSVATISTPGIPTATIFGAHVSGPISERVQVDARWTQQTAAGTPGFSRVGGYASPPYVAFFAPAWRVDLGNAAMLLSEVSGLNAQGNGASLEARSPRWSVAAIGAQPSLGVQVAPLHGSLVAASVSRQIDSTKLTATVSHLRSGGAQLRALDAVSFGATRRIGEAMNARAEVAGRHYAGGIGLGVLGELVRRDTRGEWRLRAVRAPGGADAFAMAQSDLSATGTQRVGSARVGTLAWYADDAGARGRFQRSRGISLLPQWRVGTRVSFGGEVRLTQSTGGDTLSAYGSSTRGGSLFAAGQLGRLNLSTSATLNGSLRNAQLAVGAPFQSRETQVIWTTQAALPTRLGVIDAFSGLQRAYGANVFFSGQHELQLRMENVSLPRLSERIRGGAAVGSVAALDGSSRYVTTRFSLSAILPFDAVARLDRERNPLFARGASRGGWTTVLRFERSFGAPAFLSLARTGGVVFEDTNDNGRRDSGERGIPGVVVRGAGEVAVTDRGGVYRFARRQIVDAQLDERSLPFGLMIAPRPDVSANVTAGRSLRDFAVQPVGVVEIRLMMTDEPFVTGIAPSLDPVAVIATDGGGRRFLARSEKKGVRVFDALPPGEYRLEIDASGASEPLSTRSDLPTFVVGALRAPRVFTVQLGPRKLRMFRGVAISDTLPTTTRPAVDSATVSEAERVGGVGPRTVVRGRHKPSRLQ